jgi:carbonic anhydrase
MRKWLPAIVAVLVLAGLGAAAGSEHQEAPHWSYDGAAGPDHWGDLDPAFALCKTGKAQSPINVDRTEKASLPPIRFDYRPSPLAIVDNGHTVQVNYAPGSSIEVGGHRYELKQFHFHHPSENTIHGRSSPLEIHFVHADKDGKLAVVGLLVNEGQPSVALQALWDHLPGEKTQESRPGGVTVNAADLFPRDRRYFTFPGSLTTPPCSEGVTWLLLVAPAESSSSQIETFARLYPLNARPVQLPNARAVREMQ